MCSLGAIEPNSWTVKHRHRGLVAQAVCGLKHQDLIIQENSSHRLFKMSC